MMDWRQEREEYCGKLSSQIGGMNRILSLVGTDELLNAELQMNLSRLRGKAIRLQDKLKSDEFEVAIVGLEKAGKSTFANALIGNDILPTKDARCTYTSTSIRYGNDMAYVEFFTYPEFNKNFQEKLKLLGIENYECLNFETLTLSEYQSLFNKLSDEKKYLYSGTINQDVENIICYRDNLKQFLGKSKLRFSGLEELENEYFKGFIQDPKYAIAVKEIVLESSRLSEMRNAVIYDVPGFDSPTQMHKDQTIEKMKLADVIILIANADKPSFTGPLLEIFRTESDYDGVRFGDKMFVFANRADKATSLAVNMQEIKKELTKYRIMKPENMERIIPGSARAKLEADGKVDGEAALQGLKAQGIEDNGIDKIKGMLETYNRTDRFEVLKTRINRMQNDISALFRDLTDEKKDSIIPDSAWEISNIATALLQESSQKIEKELETYRSEITNEYNSGDKPLTSKMCNDIVESLTSERYGVTEEELEWAKNKAGLVTRMDFATDIDIFLRKRKYYDIHKVFTDGVVKLAKDEHESCADTIKEIFVRGLGISGSNAYYEDIRNNIDKYLAEQKGIHDYEGYYKSLVQRFSVDLFEILLAFPYGDMARWKKFENEAANFYSISMFDQNRDMESTPDRQPLHYLILFHSRMNKTALDEACEFIKVLVGIAVDDKTLALLKKLVRLEGAGLVGNLKKMFDKLDRNKAVAAKKEIVTNSLEAIVDKYVNEGQILENEKLTRETYEKFFVGKHDKTAETVKKEIDEDIDILQDVLRSAVLNAVAIEKPFLALEIQGIKNILESLKGDSFRKFIVNNVKLVAAEQFQDLDIQMQKRMTRERILAEINDILDGMNAAG